MQLKRTAPFLLLFLLTLCACKQAKENRFVEKVEGNHRLTSFLVDGEDSLATFQAAYSGTACNALHFRFLGNEEGAITYRQIQCGEDEPSDVSPGNWLPTEKFEYDQLYLRFPYNQNAISSGFPFEADWDIVKIKKDKMEFELWRNGKFYQLVLEQ